jgi:hypothetical protein
MSFILIGFGKQTRKDLGQTGVVQQCVWCHNLVFYHLIILRTWFTYFFIPVFPYRREYLAECPICASSITIQGDEIRAAKQGELKISIQ